MRRPLLILFVGLSCLLCAPLPARASAAKKSISARLLVSNPAPFVGEEIDLSLEVHYRRYPGGRAELTWPPFDRFIASDPAASRSTRRRAADGTIVEILQRRLRPLQPGIQTLNGGRLAFGTLTVPVAPVTLSIRPLPLAGQPAGYGGLVGDYRLQLDARGRGAREVVVSVVDATRIGPTPQPLLQTGVDERLVLLAAPHIVAAGKNRVHRWRYYYLPATNGEERLAVTLPFFDPQTASYRQLQAGAVQPPAPAGRPSPHLLPLLLFLTLPGLTWALRSLWRRPRSVEACLSRLLGRDSRTLCRQEILQALDNRLDPATRALLCAWWRHGDQRRFAPLPFGIPAAPERLLRRALRKVIDKKNVIPYRDRTH